MKKTKKENIQEDSGPKKIEVKFKAGKLFFGVNGNEFFLDKEGVAFLFTREVLLELEKTEEKEIFDEFQTIENLAKFRFFSGRGMTPREIADVLGFDKARYIRWLSMNGSMITKLMSANKPAIDAMIEDLEKKYTLPEPEKKDRFWPEPFSGTTKKVAQMLLDDLKPREIAQSLKVDYSDFIKWYLNKSIMKSIMQKRDEIIQERESKAERDAARNE